jgi:hypothetical protein
VIYSSVGLPAAAEQVFKGERVRVVDGHDAGVLPARILIAGHRPDVGTRLYLALGIRRLHIQSADVFAVHVVLEVNAGDPVRTVEHAAIGVEGESVRIPRWPVIFARLAVVVVARAAVAGVRAGFY